jgi:hypothetical protein
MEQVTSQPKGEYILDLDCNERLKVSRNFRDAIKTFLAQIQPGNCQALLLPQSVPSFCMSALPRLHCDYVCRYAKV